MAEVHIADRVEATPRLIGRESEIAAVRAALADEAMLGALVLGAEGIGKTSVIEAVLAEELAAAHTSTAHSTHTSTAHTSTAPVASADPRRGHPDPGRAPAPEVVRLAGSSVQAERPYGVLRLLLAGAPPSAQAGDVVEVLAALRRRFAAPARASHPRSGRHLAPGPARPPATAAAPAHPATGTPAPAASASAQSSVRTQARPTARAQTPPAVRTPSPHVSRPPRPRPVVVVDNAHLVDEHSLSVLTQLAVHGTIRLLVGAETTAAPVDLVARLCTAGLMPRVTLHGLSLMETRELLAQRLGGPVACGSVEEVYRRTGGNPGLAIAAVDSHRTRSSIAVDHGVAVFSAPTDFSALGREYVEQRLARIDAELQRVVRIVSLAQTVPASLLGALTDPEGIDRLIGSGFLSAGRTADPEITVRDRAMGLVVASAIPPVQCRVLYDACAPAIPWTELEGSALVGLVQWAVRVGGEVDAEVLARAATVAGSQGRWQAVRDLAAGAPAGAQPHPRLLIEHARACMEQGDRSTARDLAATAGTALSELVEAEALALLPALRCVEYGSREISEPGAPPWEDDPRDSTLSESSRRVIALARANWELRCGAYPDAAARAAELAETPGSPPGLRARALALRGLALVLVGRIDEGLGEVSRAFRLGDHPAVEPAERHLVHVHVHAARSFAGVWTPELERDFPAEVTNLPAIIAYARWSLGTGGAFDGIDVLRGVLATLRRADPLGGSGAVVAALRYVLLLADRPDDAARIPVPTERPAVSWALDHEAVRIAHLADAVGSPDPARGRLRELGQAAVRIGAHLPAVRCYVDAGLLGDDAAIADLAAVSGRIDSLFGYFAQCFAAGMSSGDIPLLLEAARAASELNEIGWAQAIAEVAVARAVDVGEPELAREARRELQRSRRRLLAESAPRAGQAGLSDLERRLALDAARGDSNADLATKAHLSPKTVEWYMSRIYRKLHVTNRTGLAAALGLAEGERR